MADLQTIKALPDHVLRRHLLTTQGRCGRREAELRKIIREAQAELDELAERQRDINASLHYLTR